MLVHQIGPDAVLVEVEDTDTARALADWARHRRLAREVVPGAATVLFDGLPRDSAAVGSMLTGFSREPRSDKGPRVVLPTTYDGPDLPGVASLWDVDEATVVERHTSIEFTSAFCGFAPGFAYLSGLPDAHAVARLPEPRERVAPGSVALADTWCGVYPSASPGGWRLIGRTEAPLWDLARDEPALLAPGTRVRFEVAG